MQDAAEWTQTIGVAESQALARVRIVETILEIEAERTAENDEPYIWSEDPDHDWFQIEEWEVNIWERKNLISVT